MARAERRTEVMLQRLRRCNCPPWNPHDDECPDAGLRLVLLCENLIDEQERERTQAQHVRPGVSASHTPQTDEGRVWRPTVEEYTIKESAPTEASWIGCADLEKEYPPHQTDAYLDTSTLSDELFFGDTPEIRKTHLKMFIALYSGARGQCDPKTALKYVMQNKVEDVGLCLTK